MGRVGFVFGGWVGGAKANHCALGVSARARPASATWKRSDRAEKRRYGVAPAGHRSKTPGVFRDRPREPLLLCGPRPFRLAAQETGVQPAYSRHVDGYTVK